MKDTGFSVPVEKRIRRAGACGFNAEGRLTALHRMPGGHALPERRDEMAYVSGGQGLWSTLNDYLTFARMFVSEGTVDGVRLLEITDTVDDGFEPTDGQSADIGQDAGTPDLCRRPRIWLRSRGGNGTGEGRPTAMRRWCWRGRLAGCIRRMVAGRPKR